jgi:hypothetical protein
MKNGFERMSWPQPKIIGECTAQAGQLTQRAKLKVAASFCQRRTNKTAAARRAEPSKDLATSELDTTTSNSSALHLPPSANHRKNRTSYRRSQ